MSKITINDKWQMNYDGVQYTPEYWRDTYVTDKGKTIEAGWINAKKYFPTISTCLRYIIEQDVLAKGNMSLDEFLVEYKASADELSELVKKAIGGV
jgi:hypothetical protein